MNYEHGLELLREIAKRDGWYQEFLPYETALLENLQDEQIYGQDSSTKQARMRVVHQINLLCLRRLNTSFNDLCRGIPPSASTATQLQLTRPLGPIACFYAEDDASFYYQLRIALGLWERQGMLSWLEISAGEDVARARQQQVRQAHLILLLCSASFFADVDCHTAMLAALAEHDRRRVPVVPILARACAWEESPCGHLKVLPENKQPINAWPLPDQAYEAVRRGLSRLTPHL